MGKFALLLVVMLSVGLVACGSFAASETTYETYQSDKLWYKITRQTDGPVQYRAMMSNLVRPNPNSLVNQASLRGVIVVAGELPVGTGTERANAEAIDAAIKIARATIKSRYDEMLAGAEELKGQQAPSAPTKKE